MRRRGRFALNQLCISVPLSLEKPGFCYILAGIAPEKSLASGLVVTICGKYITMIYLIDGHNLIGKMPDISLSDPDDEEQLAHRLRQWAAENKSRQVIVIFDRGVLSGLARRLSNQQVKVFFAPTRTTADALLIKRVNEVRNPQQYRLISSDRQIIDAAKVRGMRFWRSERFVEMLGPAELPTEAADPKPHSEPAPPSQKEQPQLSREDVAEWLELFGPVPKRPSSSAKKKKLLEFSHEAEPDQPPNKPQSLTTAKRSQRQLTRAEVEEWLRFFGEDLED
jgi:uncharacterized protein